MQLACLLPLPLLAVSCGPPASPPPASASPPSSPGPPAPPNRSLETIERQMIGLLEKFDRFDYNGDGFLTRKEIRDGVREAQLNEFTPNDIDRAFAFYDTNHDNRISLHEANAGLQRGPEALAH